MISERVEEGIGERRNRDRKRQSRDIGALVNVQ